MLQQDVSKKEGTGRGGDTRSMVNLCGCGSVPAVDRADEPLGHGATRILIGAIPCVVLGR